MKKGRLVALCVLLASCAGGEQAPTNSGVYMLLDTSGTYTEELEKAEQIIRYTLSKLDASDSFAVARIDTGSFSEKDIIAKMSFDDRPSAINRQKRLFAQQVSDFVDHVRPAPYTDITGGLLQAVEFLNEKDTGKKTILIFSDLKEDLAEGYIRDIDVELAGFTLAAERGERDPVAEQLRPLGHMFGGGVEGYLDPVAGQPDNTFHEVPRATVRPHVTWVKGKMEHYHIALPELGWQNPLNGHELAAMEIGFHTGALVAVHAPQVARSRGGLAWT